MQFVNCNRNRWNAKYLWKILWRDRMINEYTYLYSIQISNSQNDSIMFHVKLFVSEFVFLTFTYWDQMNLWNHKFQCVIQIKYRFAGVSLLVARMDNKILHIILFHVRFCFWPCFLFLACINVLKNIGPWNTTGSFRLFCWFVRFTDHFLRSNVCVPFCVVCFNKRIELRFTRFGVFLVQCIVWCASIEKWLMRKGIVHYAEHSYIHGKHSKFS